MFFFLGGLDGPDLVRKLQPRVMNVNLIKITDQVFFSRKMPQFEFHFRNTIIIQFSSPATSFNIFLC